MPLPARKIIRKPERKAITPAQKRALEERKKRIQAQLARARRQRQELKQKLARKKPVKISEARQAARKVERAETALRRVEEKAAAPVKRRALKLVKPIARKKIKRVEVKRIQRKPSLLRRLFSFIRPSAKPKPVSEAKPAKAFKPKLVKKPKTIERARAKLKPVKAFKPAKPSPKFLNETPFAPEPVKRVIEAPVEAAPKRLPPLKPKVVLPEVVRREIARLAKEGKPKKKAITKKATGEKKAEKRTAKRILKAKTISKGREPNVTYVVFDLVGFTALTEQLKKEASQKYLADKRHYDDMASLISKFHSVVMKTVRELGGVAPITEADAVHGVFHGKDHVKRAVEACLTTNMLLRQLSQQTGRELVTKSFVSTGSIPEEKLAQSKANYYGDIRELAKEMIDKNGRMEAGLKYAGLETREKIFVHPDSHPYLGEFGMEARKGLLEEEMAGKKTKRDILEITQAKFRIAERKLDVKALEKGEDRLVAIMFGQSPQLEEALRGLPEAQANKAREEFQKRIKGMVEASGGRYLKPMIDNGFLVQFGAPIAREGDLELAVKTALDIKDLTSAFAREQGIEEEVNVKLGVNEGSVTITESQTPSGPIMDLIGSPANIAARLMMKAKPGQVIVKGDIHRLIKSSFRSSEQGRVELKGIAEPVDIFNVEAFTPKPKLEALFGEGATPLVGRQEELKSIEQTVLDAFKKEQLQIISVAGEAGTGKSRILFETRNALEKEGAKVFSGSSFAHGAEEYRPIKGLVRDVMGFGEGEAPETARRLVQEKVSSLFPKERQRIVGEALMHFLGYQSSLMMGMDPQYRSRLAEGAVTDLFKSQSKKNPIILALEDAHYADPSSLAFFQRLAEEAKKERVVLWQSYRPDELKGKKVLDGAGKKVELKTFKAGEAGKFIQSMLGAKAITPELEALAKKAGHTPYFIEEIVKDLKEREVLVLEKGEWVLKQKVEEIEIPSTIEKKIEAKIDRLRSKNAQAAESLLSVAVLGREFEEATAVKLLSLASKQSWAQDPVQVKDLLMNLADEGFLRVISETPRKFIFTHDLAQEVAYKTNSKPVRLRNHVNAIEAIETVQAANIERFYDKLIDHARYCGEKEKLVDYSLKAGEQAFENYQNEKAERHYREALEKMDPNDMHRAEAFYWVGRSLDARRLFKEAYEIASEGLKWAESQKDSISKLNEATRVQFFIIESKLNQVAGKAVVRIDPVRRPEGILHYEKALEAAEKSGDKIIISSVLNGLGTMNRDPEKVKEYYRRSLEMKRKHNITEGLGNLYANFGILANREAKWADAVKWYQLALEQPEPVISYTIQRHHYLAENAIALWREAKTAEEKNRFEVMAREHLDKARALQEKSGVPADLSEILQVEAIFWYTKGDLKRSVEVAEEGLKLAMQYPSMKASRDFLVKGLLEVSRELNDGRRIEKYTRLTRRIKK